MKNDGGLPCFRQHGAFWFGGFLGRQRSFGGGGGTWTRSRPVGYPSATRPRCPSEELKPTEVDALCRLDGLPDVVRIEKLALENFSALCRRFVARSSSARTKALTRSPHSSRP